MCSKNEIWIAHWKNLWAEESFAMSGKESVGEYWYSQAENRSATSYTLCISMTPAPPAADAVSPVLWSTLGRRHPQDVYLCQHWLEDRKQPMEGNGFKTLIDTLPSFSSTAPKKPDWEGLRWAFQPSAWQGRATWGSKGWRGTRTRCRSRCAYRASPPFGNLLLFCDLISLRWLLKLYCLVLGGLGLLLCLVRKISSYLLSYN